MDRRVGVLASRPRRVSSVVSQQQSDRGGSLVIFWVLIGALIGQRFRFRAYWVWSGAALLAWWGLTYLFHVEDGPIGQWLMSSSDGAARSFGFLVSAVVRFVPRPSSGGRASRPEGRHRARGFRSRLVCGPLRAPLVPPPRVRVVVRPAIERPPSRRCRIAAGRFSNSVGAVWSQLKNYPSGNRRRLSKTTVSWLIAFRAR